MGFNQYNGYTQTQDLPSSTNFDYGLMPSVPPTTGMTGDPPQLSDKAAPTSQVVEYLPYRLMSVPDPQNGKNGSLHLEFVADRSSTRVETCISGRLVIRHPRDGIEKLRLHRNHAYKPKHFGQLDSTKMAADTLQLRATAFSSLAMKDPTKRAAALARAKAPGEVFDDEDPSPSPGRDDSIKDDTIKAHAGEPIQVCPLCTKREAVRLQRSWPKLEKGESRTPEEEAFLAENAPKPVKIAPQKAIESWKRPLSCTTSSAQQLNDAPSVRRPARRPKAKKSKAKSKAKSKVKSNEEEGEDEEEGEAGKKKEKKLPPPPAEEGTIAVDFSLRVCCYCRHHKEPEGFQ